MGAVVLVSQAVCCLHQSHKVATHTQEIPLHKGKKRWGHKRRIHWYCTYTSEYPISPSSCKQLYLALLHNLFSNHYLDFGWCKGADDRITIDWGVEQGPRQGSRATGTRRTPAAAPARAPARRAEPGAAAQGQQVVGSRGAALGSCGCTKGDCSNMRCGCRRNQRQCGPRCKCSAACKNKGLHEEPQQQEYDQQQLLEQQQQQLEQQLDMEEVGLLQQEHHQYSQLAAGSDMDEEEELVEVEQQQQQQRQQ